MIRRAGPALAAALVLAADGYVLVAVARNRSGEPDAQIRLTERELSLPFVRPENSGLSLRMSWNRSAVPVETDQGRPAWLDRAKLESIGFDCSLPPSDPSARERYARALPRETYAVLEYEGKSWDQWLDGQRKRLEEIAAAVERREKTTKELQEARDRLDRSARTMSRLFVVDVGNDAEALRTSYPDRSRYVIAPAVVSLHLAEDATALAGEVRRLMIGEIHVPRDSRGLLNALVSADESKRAQVASPPDRSPPAAEAPRYEVTLRFGRRHEPWVTAVRPLDAGGAAGRGGD